MADDVYRPEKRRISSAEMGMDDSNQNMETLKNIQAIQRAVAAEIGDSSSFGGEPPVKMKGNIPPGMLDAIRAAQGNNAVDDGPEEFHAEIPHTIPSVKKNDGSNAPRRRQQSNPFADARQSPTNEQFEALINRIKGLTHHYTPVELPSKGKFYDGTDGPENGVLHVRPMTGEEEQILATPRFAKGGKGIDMIFRNCIQERINPEKLLTVDRTYVLIFLRGISYGRNYDVEIRCPECTQKFPTTVDLEESLNIENCPDEFDVNSLTDVMPVSGFRFSYRLSRGRDESLVQQYRDKKIKNFSDAADDTLAYRAALLLTEIEGLTDHRQIQALHRQLPIGDVSYIRNAINEPPFGVDTEIPMLCPFCYAEFNTDLPLDTNFFFPRPKKKEDQASS